jgi:hypothetical protein
MPSVNAAGYVVNEFEPVPDPPPAGATKLAHVEYAVSQGIPYHVALQMTKAELVARFRPGEGEGVEEQSAGTSSLTSGSSSARSGGSALETGASRPSPAQGTGSRSAATPAEPEETPGASAAGSAGGSTPETGRLRKSPPTSSADSTPTDTGRGRTGRAE